MPTNYLKFEQRITTKHVNKSKFTRRNNFCHLIPQIVMDINYAHLENSFSTNSSQKTITYINVLCTIMEHFMSKENL